MSKYDKYKDQLEYTAFHNQFLTACVRVCVVDASSPILPKLKNAFISSFPDYNKNPYISSVSKKHKLLSSLLFAERFRTVAMIMKLNDLVKRK